jgi:hypothetical protein
MFAAEPPALDWNRSVQPMTSTFTALLATHLPSSRNGTCPLEPGANLMTKTLRGERGILASIAAC